MIYSNIEITMLQRKIGFQINSYWLGINTETQKFKDKGIG